MGLVITIIGGTGSLARARWPRSSLSLVARGRSCRESSSRVSRKEGDVRTAKYRKGGSPKRNKKGTWTLGENRPKNESRERRFGARERGNGRDGSAAAEMLLLLGRASLSAYARRDRQCAVSTNRCTGVEALTKCADQCAVPHAIGYGQIRHCCDHRRWLRPLEGASRAACWLTAS